MAVPPCAPVLNQHEMAVDDALHVEDEWREAHVARGTCEQLQYASDDKCFASYVIC